jgi:hypothetical protein
MLDDLPMLGLAWLAGTLQHRVWRVC